MSWAQLSREVFLEINRFRNSPSSIIEDLENRLNNFDKNNILKRKGEVNIKTKEGPAAVE
jgi:hypothetical protein